MAKIDFNEISREAVDKVIKEFEFVNGVTLKDSINKQISKKMDYYGDGCDENGNILYDYAKCPVCGNDYEYEINDWECNYCSNCGQKLDWN